MPLSRIVGDRGRAHAIESHPEAFSVRCSNLALNGIRNTLPINAYVAATGSPNVERGWGESAYVDDSWPSSLVSIAVDLPHRDLIKIDFDGNELDVLRSGEMQSERHRPILYVENDVRESSSKLINFMTDKLGYDLFWHAAPIFEVKNFFHNPDNHWAPRNICSPMMVGVPAERKMTVGNLPRVAAVRIGGVRDGFPAGLDVASWSVRGCALDHGAPENVVPHGRTGQCAHRR